VLTALALDIGGSGVRAARVGPEGVRGPVERRPLDATLSQDEVVRRLRYALAALSPGDDAGVGVSFPSFLDDRGRVGWCLNLPGLDGVDLRAALAPVAGGLVVRPVPDLAAAALAEARLGAGREVERFLCVAIGTGVNAAMTVGGRLLETAVGCLGDAGHVSVEPDSGLPCACGGVGCLEAIASGPALARAGGGAAAYARAGRALGRAIAAWSALLWPERVAVGGGVGAAAGDRLLEPARAELRRVGASYIVGRIELVSAALGPDAALAGAGLVALEP